MINLEYISEKFLHYIWRNNLFDKKLSDTKGNPVDVISVGILNTDAGPDFFNAKIRIGDTNWAGNVEIHIKSSDWYKHKHHVDKAYNNVILQVVYENDKETFCENKRNIPTVILKFDNQILENYSKLSKNEEIISCNKFIARIDNLNLNNWLSSLLIERAQQKTAYPKSLFNFKTADWEEIFYILTARAFGFKVNALPFELLAKSLPSIILAKHKNNKFQIEAMLFGQAGMLNEENIEDDYYLKLKKEYHFLKSKYKLQAIENHLWKFLRIRPSNFPTIRISQFADLIYKSSHLFSKILEVKKVSELQKIFQIEAAEYWMTHYKFGNETGPKSKNIGKSAINSIIINTVIPVLFLYGKEKDNYEITEKAIIFLENIKAEKNNITKKWENAGLEIKNAYFSQSLIQLYNEYCTKNRCLDCRIGHQYIQQRN